MADWREKLSKLKNYLEKDIWEIDTRSLTRGRTFLLRQAQIASLVVRDFFADHCLLRASALTYATLLSIVPLLAIAFSLLKGFGVQNTLEPIILKRIAVGSEEIVSQIVNYIDNTKVGQLGALGLLILIVTVLALLSNIEEIFNHIWGVKETRPLFRRFADYFSVVVVGPVFVFAAISMTTTLESQAVVQQLLEVTVVGELLYLLFKVLPFVAMWAAFIFLYLFMPNTKVDFRAALVGGIFGGTLWQLAQWGYVTFQIGVSRYNAIYGTLAALPILMVWIYLSWLIVLLGLEVTYAVQNLRTIRREIRGENLNFASRELAALTVLLVLGENFYRGERPWSQEKIAVELELPPRLAQNILAELVQLGYLSKVVKGADDETAYQPARAPETISLHGIMEALRQDGVSFTRLRETPERQVVQELEENILEAGRQALEGLTLQDLIRRMLERKDRNEGEAATPEDGG